MCKDLPNLLNQHQTIEKNPYNQSYLYKTMLEHVRTLEQSNAVSLRFLFRGSESLPCFARRDSSGAAWTLRRALPNGSVPAKMMESFEDFEVSLCSPHDTGQLENVDRRTDKYNTNRESNRVTKNPILKSTRFAKSYKS